MRRCPFHLEPACPLRNDAGDQRRKDQIEYAEPGDDKQFATARGAENRGAIMGT